MNVIGIIIEANPFHNGHKYLIDEIKKQYPNDLIVAVTTTSFTMRGEVSVINKFDKTKYLLDAGVNIVLEFPFILSMQSSDYFASNAVKILSDIGVTDIICGCEDNNIKNIYDIYNIETSTIFKNKFKELLSLHKSYKQTYELTFKELNIDQYLINLFSKPNFTLAYQYYKAIKTNHGHINFSLIKRTNSYDNEDLSSSIVSAKAIRKAIYENLDCNQYLPFKENIIDLTNAENVLLNIINYKVQIDKSFSETINDEGIINYIINNINAFDDYKTTINNLCNKRYTISRIRRHLLYLLLNINEFYHNSTYLRILGIDKFGLSYISTLDKEVKSIIFASIKELNSKDLCYNIAEIELNATKLYSQITKNNDLLIKEYQLPIRKD